jgi:hypothetical protein
MKKVLLALLLSCIDLEKLVIGLVEGVGEEALKEAAAKTATPLDDAALAILLPAINPAMETIVKAKVAALKASVEAMVA